MSQDYLHACERAELLGLPVPSEEEWKETRAAEAENAVEDDDTAIQVLDSSDEAAQRVGGKLDELNSILNATQKKINRFKTVCGSLGTLLKVRVGSRNNTPNHKPAEQSCEEAEEPRQETPAEDENLTIELSDETQDTKNPAGVTQQKKVDINDKLGSHLDKLDSLISRAENSQYSMQHQTKQMKKFLK